MSEEGYSTVMDAVLFLTLVCACAVILSPALSSHMIERSAADRGLREMAADVLCSLETEQVDYFEYRVLGDITDRIAAMGGINATGDILYKDMAKALLGRGNRHATVMDIAVRDAACQFLIEYGDAAVRANPVTAEYDGEVSKLIDRAIRSGLDSRYQYEFTLRWTPLAGVPIAGKVSTGSTCPAGAASSSMHVSMPYTTNITVPVLARINSHDLKDIDRSIEIYRAEGDMISLRHGLGTAIEGCLKNSTALALGEIWNNTLGSSIPLDNSPFNVLKRLVDGKVPDGLDMIGLNVSLEDITDGLASLCFRDEADWLAGYIARGIADGRLDAGDARQMVLDWVKARYEPSSATVTISIWTGDYA
jgi:hypothetical protein